MLKSINKGNKMESKDWLVVKSNSLINAKGKVQYTRNELKLIANLVATIHPSDTNLKGKRIRLKDLGFILDDTKNHKTYDLYFQELMSKPFKIEHLWFNWFSRLGYKDGYIEYSFDDKLKPYLLELKANFTKYNLENILQLKSSYSIHIYELLVQYKDKGFRNILIDDFREILGIPKKNTNAHIKEMLKRTQKDLIENTNIKFKFDFVKDGRSFKTIKFKVESNKPKNQDKHLFNYDEKNYDESTLEAYEEMMGYHNEPQEEQPKEFKSLRFNEEIGGNYE